MYLYCDIMVEGDEARKSNDETQTTHGMHLRLATHIATRDNFLATARHSAATLPRLLTGRGEPPPLHTHITHLLDTHNGVKQVPGTQLNKDN